MKSVWPIDFLETALNAVKEVQLHQVTDIAHIKNLLVTQQQQIEDFDEGPRRKNLIFTNVPEADVTFEGSTISKDIDKVKTLVQFITSKAATNFDTDNIEEVTRFGRSGGKSPRILKVRVADVNCRNQILRSSRHLNVDAIRISFGRIYINKYVSFEPFGGKTIEKTIQTA